MDRQTVSNSRTSPSSFRALRGIGLATAGVLALGLLAPQSAWAGPRDEMKAAYDAALAQANNLEYDQANNILNTAISGAESAGNGQDPVLASLYMLRAALTFSAEGHGAAAKILADLQRAVSLNYYVVVPMEMRSDDIAAYMQQARQASGASAPQAITLTEPVEACGAPLHFEVLLSVPDGGQAALYWRKAGSDSEFIGAEMPAFSNVAEVDIPAAEHGDVNIEYFIYAFDASMNPAANLGLQDQPLVLEQSCADEGPDEVEPTVEDEPKKPKGPSSLPRVWINLGVGTGFGIAGLGGGTAENTYRQFFPAGSQVYGPAESGCAIARWVAGPRDVQDVPAAELIQAFDSFGAPGTTGDMMTAYNAEECAEHHPVSTGFAMAPFHIAPELSFRVGKRVSLGVYGRLQVVTGASMFRDDPGKDLTTSFAEDVRNPTPVGVKQTTKFTWAVGAKFKYFLGKETSKFRPFVGAFAGGGAARLRVNMGFANDRNGNSIPDDLEVGADTDLTGTGCYPVWPYNGACTGDQTDPTSDTNLAANVTATANSANRVDVARIGPFFFGALVGFNYQIVKNFALFGELHIGGWLPNDSSMLIDITVGPAITF
ncbi:hypothetical protein [Enhygromyxa salina]|uniref:Uncharacterized protein n=1 Tax=Enhygromyxa salina TaxID=215803 RepID=A0A2S9Y6C1_9BACT|nr:hypothetical protein [Enhygromyxa salina]PRQ00551.1 hypothetical protein ENSA7_60450 [Enhygromyxa salina]